MILREALRLNGIAARKVAPYRKKALDRNAFLLSIAFDLSPRHEGGGVYLSARIKSDLFY